MKDKMNINVHVILDNLNKKNFGRNLFLFVMGMLISSFAYNLFFAPNHVIPTGSSGLASLISIVFEIDMSLITFE